MRSFVALDCANSPLVPLIQIPVLFPDLFQGGQVNDPLVPKQISLPFSMKIQLKRASLLSGLSQSEIMRNALLKEIRRMKIPLEDGPMIV